MTHINPSIGRFASARLTVNSLSVRVLFTRAASFPGIYSSSKRNGGTEKPGKFSGAGLVRLADERGVAEPSPSPRCESVLMLCWPPAVLCVSAVIVSSGVRITIFCGMLIGMIGEDWLFVFCLWVFYGFRRELWVDFWCASIFRWMGWAVYCSGSTCARTCIRYVEVGFWLLVQFWNAYFCPLLGLLKWKYMYRPEYV